MDTNNELTENRKLIALDAASLGRLTRLQEEVVETTTADTKQEKSDDAWTLKRASQTAMLKTSFHRCVQEAAVVGFLQCITPVEVVSSPKQEDGSSLPIPKPPSADWEYELSTASEHRASQVLEAHVKGTHREKARSWKSSLATLERMDQQEETRRVWLEHHQEVSTSGSADTCRSSLSPLPSPVVPQWRKRISSGVNKYKLMECISNEAANQAFERAWRLENESQHELKVRKGCTCVYCSGTPSPYQTQEYQRLHQQQKREVTPFPSYVDLDDDDLSSIGSASFMDSSSHDGNDIQRTTVLVPKQVHTINNARPPRSLTPPRRSPRTAKITTQRWSSTPMPTSTTTSSEHGVPPMPPSWVSPIANRKHINYKKTANKKTANKKESLAPPISPCAVSSVVVLERESLDILTLQKSSSGSARPRKCLDGEFDEEQLLREELVALGIADP